MSDDRTIDSGEDERLALESELVERREAALAQVIKLGDPVLKSRASPVTAFGEDLRSEVDRMIAIMRDGLGVGLAATQIGALRRVLVFQTSHDAEPAALVNPKIGWRSDELVTAEEGCLSLPRVSMDVERPLHVIVTGSDVDGAAVKLEASGLEARILQHEIDHLDGVLILDHAPRDQRRGALRALREGGSYSPPVDGEPAEPEDRHGDPRSEA